MRISMGLSAFFTAGLSSALLLAGCASDDEGESTNADASAPGSVDASNTASVDAGPPRPDATPGPDGGPAALACAGETLPPTVANPPITISGSVKSVATIAGPETLSVSAKLSALQISNNSLIVSADSVVGSGTNTFSLVDPQGAAAPLAAYVKATAPGHVDTYLYPPYDIYENFTNALFLMFGDDLWTLVPAVAGVSKTDGTGVIMIIVADCDQEAVGGAKVSISPDVGVIRYSGDNGLPSSALTQTQGQGLAFIFNVPPGEYTVDAVRDGVSFREHTVETFDGAATTTILVP